MLQQHCAPDCRSCPTTNCCIDAFNKVVKARGGRLTDERLLLLRGICGHGDHWTPEDLSVALRGTATPLASTTIYRNLPLLEEAGIVRRVGSAAAGDSTTRYEHVWGRAHHDHLLCSRCGRKVEFSYPAIEVLQETVAREHGFVLERHRFELIGVCGDCQQSRKPA